MKVTLKQVVEDTDTAPGRYFNLVIECLIVLSLVSFSIETLPGLSQTVSHVLRVIEVVTVVIFTAEYLLRLLVTDQKLRYVFSFYGLVDLLAILPFYVARGIDLRAIRVLRLFRLFRIFKILRYSRAISRFQRAFLEVRHELVLFLIACVFLLYLASIGIYYFESEAQPDKFQSVFHSMWWAVATITTVGYGDVYPVTLGGRMFTSFLLLIGLGTIAVPSGLIASALTKTLSEEEDEQ